MVTKARQPRSGRRQRRQPVAVERPLPSPPPPGTVVIGSRVTTRDEQGAERVFVIARPSEADATRGYLSAAAPVGAALLGRRAGDTVDVRVPAGQRRLTVVAVV